MRNILFKISKAIKRNALHDLLTLCTELHAESGHDKVCLLSSSLSRPHPMIEPVLYHPMVEPSAIFHHPLVGPLASFSQLQHIQGPTTEFHRAAYYSHFLPFLIFGLVRQQLNHFSCQQFQEESFFHEKKKWEEAGRRGGGLEHPERRFSSFWTPSTTLFDTWTTQ